MKKKTISGARAMRGQRSDGCNPAHNNRDYLPSNADPNRQHLNKFWIESTKAVTIEQIYEKLFQPAYDEWLDKEHAKGRQKDAPEKYIDKIRNSPKKKNQKREQYEIIWQIGDMKNTGWNSDRDDFEKARQLLIDFAGYLQKLPEVTYVDENRLDDPDWKPPFNCGLIVTNLSLHGDENTPQIHMDFIPYAAGCKRGQKIQNAYAAAFEGMGYSVEQEQAKDDAGELLWKKDKDGEFVLDKNGEKVPVMRKVSFGSIDWIEKQKGWIQQRMMDLHSWEREYKGRNKFGDVTLSDYIVEDNARTILEQEQQSQVLADQIEDAKRIKDEISIEAGKMLTVYRDAKEMTARAQDRKNEVEQELAAIEHVRSNPDGTYDNILYLADACSDELFRKLDRMGMEMRESDLQNNLFKADLDRQIAAAEQDTQGQRKLWDFWHQLSEEYKNDKKNLRWDRNCGDNRRAYYDAQYIFDTTHNIFVAAWAFLKMVVLDVKMILHEDPEEKTNRDYKWEKFLEDMERRFDAWYFHEVPHEPVYDMMDEYLEKLDTMVEKVDVAERKFRSMDTRNINRGIFRE